MTINGRVTADGHPVEGASVSINELKVSTSTNVDGQYGIIVRLSDVRGQTVTIVVRHRRYGTQSAQIALVGGSVVQDFSFSSQPAKRAAPTAGPSRVVPLDTSFVLSISRRVVDSTAFAEAAGPLDIASGLSGRMPGLLTTGAAVPGSTSLLLFRGPRSIAGDIQPLVVLDGVPLHTSAFPSATQMFGLGGFDYGSPIQDIALVDIASVTLLRGPDATARFGSRAANGVLFITSKRGGGLSGMHVTANEHFTFERATRVPSYQNAYGQGLGGQFEFFDGSGGGINDAVDQSWGPKMEGQPIIQASLREPRRPDVRAWVPDAKGVQDYFGGAKTLDANVAVDGGQPTASYRMSLNGRLGHGLTPRETNRRLGVTLTGSTQLTTRLTAQGSLQAITTRAQNRPGTGFDEINPVSGFTRMGRQVDLAALRTRIRDSVEQINWIYTTRNNPFFQSLENSNDDHRGHVIASGVVGYHLTEWLGASINAGTDNYHESRNFQVAPGWKGGYPTALGRGDFSGGGSQNEKISAAERRADVSFDARATRALGFDVAGRAGLEVRSNSFQTTIAIRDSTAGSATATSGDFQTGSYNVTSLYTAGSFSRAEYLLVNVGLRLEQGSALPTRNNSAVFPSVSVAYDAAATIGALRETFGLGAARLRADFWQAGNELTDRTLAQAFVQRAASTAPTVGVVADTLSGPERTTGLELGATLTGASGRLGLDFGFYHERSSDVLVPIVSSADSAGQTGAITNSGYEVQLRAAPFHEPAGLSWDLAVSFSQNKNRVEKLAPGVDQIALGPSLWGATLLARVGQPLGVIAGTRYLRDAASDQLLLRNGLPIPDSSAGVALFGSWQPTALSSLRSSIRYRSLEFAFLVDARMGGKIFSATNMWGSYAGTLSTTLAGRDTGMIIVGIDSATGSPNATRVSAEDYFHSLGAIHEPWIFNASYAKLRDARITFERPLTFLPGFRDDTGRLSIIARNLATWAKAPNIDPETALSPGVFQGFEMGQLPGTRSIGIAVSITP